MAAPPRSRLPSIAQTLLFLRDPEELMARMRKRHGDVFRVDFLGSPPIIYLADPGLVRELFSGDGDVGLAGAARRPYFEPRRGSFFPC